MTQPSADELSPRPDPKARLAALGLQLPKPPAAVGNFAAAVRDGRLLYLSGQGPVHAGGVYTGKVGAEVSLEDAYQHARLTTLNLLAVIEEAVGLSKVSKVVKVLGMVNAAPDFIAHPAVINGCSDLLVEVFGAEVGAHARSAVGMGSLPYQITVEIEMIVAVED
ncbi:RidA family protein [Caulobacter sp. UNC279MFTsu5.1]|uniref:RidA family protein n=1 Tax=Caulobacter sp. UNC279MFTsu5.1 TaxID=1502775 RepID=UPI0003A12BA5|nr:RidA family protein [Caulobacter sp. UNC279MFTsu5.1]SFI57766.1 Enamine deaminase RidA, house cleaning of reactive enamine intermediates, YjgF/YER057c/UK114 family [Caulobacter sp. UNC279MFTsu5.1]